MDSLQETIRLANAVGLPPLHPTRAPPPLARDFMVTNVMTFHPDDPLEKAIEAMVKNAFSGAPVTTKEGHVVGALSEFDCMKLIACNSFYHERTLDGVRVSDVMSELRATIEPNTDLFGIVHRFLTKRVRRLPVLDNKKLVGLVSRRDVLRKIHELYG